MDQTHSIKLTNYKIMLRYLLMVSFVSVWMLYNLFENCSSWNPCRYVYPRPGRADTYENARRSLLHFNYLLLLLYVYQYYRAINSDTRQSRLCLTKHLHCKQSQVLGTRTSANCLQNTSVWVVVMRLTGEKCLYVISQLYLLQEPPLANTTIMTHMILLLLKSMGQLGALARKEKGDNL